MSHENKSIFIKRSHDRSKAFGIEPDRIFPRHIIKGNELHLHLEQKKELIDIALPIIQQLLETVEKSGFIIVLTDEEGCILNVEGGQQTIEASAKMNMSEGAYMSEQSIGTNAMGTAISENTALQITAKEHFISVYKNWTCSAAPIHYKGKIIGTLNLTGQADMVHPHTLGLVMAAVDAIENKLVGNGIQEELEASNQYAWAMMNNLSYGVFAIDLNEEILWVNDTACRNINIRRKELLGKTIQSLLPDWKKIQRIIINDLKYLDQESSFSIPEIQERFLLNAFLIKNEEKDILGYLLTLRPLSRMLDLVKKYTGLHARYSFSDILAFSPKTIELIQYAKSISNSPSTVLITGDSGTGKEVFAQSIHNASDQREGAFVAINCGAISPSLIESELFGYEEGAFTGAKKGGRPGKFELADGGTIFLDEIGEMPMDMQVRLLRVLQEGSVTRLGGQNQIKVNTRVIAATNNDIEKQIHDGKFRLDLFYRLNVIPLKIPPLSQRKDDIIPLARHFVVVKADKLNKPAPELTPEIINSLLSYSWPGNIRELENYIEKLVNLGGAFQSPEDKSGGLNINMTKSNIMVTSSQAGIKPLEQVEKEAIVTALTILKGNISQVATHLHIGRNTLYSKIKKFGIDLKDFIAVAK